MKRARHVLVIATFVVGAMVATQGAAFATPPTGPMHGEQGQFLCPFVGNDTAAAANDKGWANPQGEFWTFEPGNNKAGYNANYKAYNPDGPGATDGPGGGNSDWSPIWPGDFFED